MTIVHSRRWNRYAGAPKIGSVHQRMIHSLPHIIPSIRLVVTNASSAEFREKEKKVIDLGFFLGSLRRWDPL